MKKPHEFPPLGQGGKGRLVVDYRAANRATKRKLAVMTDQWVMIRDAARALLMTLADAYSGFSHLVLGKVAKSLTVMATSLGLIEWDTMPQGVVNGPAEFQNAMNHCFSELMSEGCLKAFIDDLNLTTGGTRVVRQQTRSMSCIFKSWISWRTRLLKPV